ncbi:glycerol-3-phosphate 1-O-acyltransferase PlsB [Neptuniibacter marinus]|uniref:glycerol-3-phosphate 1-O-acyltransferase PlsB n=1 Tax=Neptuniibacter marinus TaxID=1806670 RepID=UPI00082E4958|nr:glycerol-3-phosphate 1-O-acyltransferase PlsB [Neptuniibacter marinus]
MIPLLERGIHSLGGMFINLVTRPKLVNPQLLLPTQPTPDHIYYILESNRLSHTLLLKNLLRKQQRHIKEEQILFADSKGQAPLREALEVLVNAQNSSEKFNTLIIPVAIFHGRLPNREKSWLNLLYAETWHEAGPIGSFFQLLVNGRQTLVRIDKALDLKQLLQQEENDDSEATARKAARVLRTHFSITRQSIIGPDLSHRRTLINLVIKDPNVQQAIDQQAKERGTSRHRIERHCAHTLDKIAADFSPITTRILDPLLNWVWGRLYRKVRIANIERVQEIAKTHQLIYLPCHRSHMDYLLLSWVLYRHGLMIPHVAAGENLNIPVIGPILKRSGAIFMRRQFHGDPLYSCLYKTYLEQMTHRGHSLEYFIEGGRSRTGRLLAAKTGLLSMSVESYRDNPQKPVALIPVWVGYDRLVESKSYQEELSGGKKQQESISTVLATSKILGQKFGNTLLSFGEPLLLEAHIHPEHSSKEDVKLIAATVMRRINQAAEITQSSLLATCLLGGSPLQSVAELSDKSSRLLNLIKTLNPHLQLIPEGKPSDWINEAAKMQQVNQKINLIEIDQHQAQELCFYRNNIQHLLILPSMYLLLAHRLENGKTQSINRTIRMIYPFIQAELFLPWELTDLTGLLKQVREALIEQNLLEGEADKGWTTTANPLVNTLILTAEPILLRYYIVLRTLARYNEISAEDLIESSQNIAQHIHKEYGYSTPEYKDKRVLNSFIKQLHALEFLREENGRLSCNFDTSALFAQAKKILKPHMISLVDSKLGSKG